MKKFIILSVSLFGEFIMLVGAVVMHMGAKLIYDHKVAERVRLFIVKWGQAAQRVTVFKPENEK